MPDLHRMDRVWLSSVVFTDIVKFTRQSVEQQMKWKARFDGYLANAIRDVPEEERLVRDTGDGAAICFLGAPEAAMFAALELWQSFIRDEQDQHPPLRVRIGINLGPVQLVKDINGALNPIGDGINAAQRVMSFAPENQILVSQSFYEVVSRLSDDYHALFTLKGVETDKHVREHTVYNLYPPGADRGPISTGSSGPAAAPVPDRGSYQGLPAPGIKADDRGRSIPLIIAGVALVVVVVAAVAAAAAWLFSRPVPMPAIVIAPPVARAPAPETTPAVAPLFAFDDWLNLGWSRDNGALVKQGGDFVLAPPELSTATIQFTARVLKGKRLEWVVAYREPKYYDLFQMDDANFTRTPVVDGKHGKTVKVPHGARRDFSNTFSITITPRSIVHSILRDQQWVQLDSFEPPEGIPAGKFGFHIPGKDQIALNDFKITLN